MPDNMHEAERDDLAHELWTTGLNAHHAGCKYADGEGDADYQNDCPVCRDHLARVAEAVLESDWLKERVQAAVDLAVDVEVGRQGNG